MPPITHGPGPRTPLTLGLLLLAGCDAFTPEGRMQAFIERAEVKVESGDRAALRGMLSEDFIGQGTMTRDHVMEHINGYLLSHPEVHVARHTADLSLRGAHEADIELWAALTDTPVGDGAGLAAIESELLHIRARIQADKDGDLRITSAEWREVSLDELIRAGWTGDAR